jgi:excisionase family DNA binding protein
MSLRFVAGTDDVSKSAAIKLESRSTAEPQKKPRARPTRRRPPPSTDGEFLTVEEVAALVRTTKKAVYLMIDRNALAGVYRFGRRVLVKRSELLASIEEGRVLSPGGRR